MASLQKIAIIGAGPAGLTLARLLHVSKAKFDLTIYELDASPTSRDSQGGTLDLHHDTGLAAVRKCGLWDEFSKHARYDGEEMIIADKNWTKLVHMGGGDRQGNEYDRPEIDREKLRQMLLDSVPASYVKWGRRVTSVGDDGMLRFAGREQTEGPFDLIVGADGAWSKIRTKLTDIKPVYAGVSGFEMDIPEPAKTCPRVDKMVGRGNLLGASDRQLLNAQRIGTGAIKVRSWFMCPEGETKETLDKYGKTGTRDRTLTKYEGWAPEMLDMFKQGDVETLRQWTFYELPVGSKWEHQKGYTLIGDAASLMSPFGGEGVNKAMRDSLELAQWIEKSQIPDEKLTLDRAVLHYEQEMFPRAEKVQQFTMTNKLSVFATDAPIGTMVGMMKYITSESESRLVRLLGARPFLAAFFSYLWVRKQVGWAVRTFWRRT